MDKQIIIYDEKKDQPNITNTTFHLWLPLQFCFIQPYSYYWPYYSTPKIEIPKEINIKSKICDQKDIKKI